MGNTLQEQGKLEEAIDAYNKALSIKPDYAEAHRNLSVIKNYIEDDGHIFQVQELYKQEDLNENARCKLTWAFSLIKKCMKTSETWIKSFPLI